MNTLWKAIKALVRHLFKRTKQVFAVVIQDLAEEVSDIINDPEIQRLALACVVDIAEQGLTGKPANEAAHRALEAAMKERGKAAAGSILNNLLENAYLYWKYGPQGEATVSGPAPVPAGVQEGAALSAPQPATA